MQYLPGSVEVRGMEVSLLAEVMRQVGAVERRHSKGHRVKGGEAGARARMVKAAQRLRDRLRVCRLRKERRGRCRLQR